MRNSAIQYYDGNKPGGQNQLIKRNKLMYKNDQSNHIKDNLSNFNQINNIISNRHRQLSQLTSLGNDPCIRPHNISRSTATGCVWKYKLSKKRRHQGIFCSEMEVFLVKRGVFLVKKGLYMLGLHLRVKTLKTGKRQKQRKYGRWLKTFRRQNGNYFLRKGHSKILVREISFGPPNSAPSLRLCVLTQAYLLSF